MNCKVCNKDVFKHTSNQVEKCLAKADINLETKEIFNVMTQAGLFVSINYKHSIIGYKGEQFVTDDIERDLLRLCLLGENIPEIYSMKKEREDFSPEAMWKLEEEVWNMEKEQFEE